MRRCMSLFVLFVGAVAALYGQNAGLSGFIVDSTKAVVPRAAVEIRGTDTGLKFTTVSNETGLYSFSSLKPGVYDITVQAKGFQTEVRRRLKLDVLELANLDFVLKVGEGTKP